MTSDTEKSIFNITIFLLLFCLLMLPRSAAATVFTDQDGNEHVISHPFQRIISLYPAHTENLAEMGAIGSLIGISTSDDFPASVLHLEKFSYHDSVEKFISARPDCVLIRPMIRNSAGDLVEKLQQLNIAVISLQPTSAEELFRYWEILGQISGQQQNASTMVKTFKEQLNRFSLLVRPIPLEERPRVYFESIHSRMKTFSPDSIAIFCLTSAGGINVAADAVARHSTNIAGYSKERILAKADRIDVFLAQNGRMNRISRDEIIREPGFGAIKAIQDNRVYLIDETLISRPTLRLLEGIERIHKLLFFRENIHPQREIRP